MVQGKHVTFFLRACVDSKHEGRFYASVELGHVIVGLGLGDQGVGGTNVVDENPGQRSFGGIVERGIIEVLDCHRQLVPCDGADDDVSVPRLTFGEVGGSSCFARGCGSRWIEQILKRDII